MFLGPEYSDRNILYELKNNLKYIKIKNSEKYLAKN